MSRLRMMFAVCGDILCFCSCLSQTLCSPQSDFYSGSICVEWSWEFFKKDSFVTETVPNTSNWVSQAEINVLFLWREQNCFRKHGTECIRKQEEWQPHQYSAAISKQEPVYFGFFFSFWSFPSFLKSSFKL